jgi:hypothetical protein
MGIIPDITYNPVVRTFHLLAGAVSLFAITPILTAQASVQGSLRRWERVTLTFTGPQTSEDANPNPFTEYRLEVAFKHTRSGKTLTVPGFFAADGNAAESSATAGDKWRVHFTPDQDGEWTYLASFHRGENAVPPDGARGTLRIAASKAKGLLQYSSGHYLKFAGTGEYFLKGGADSPENFLAYDEFDATYDTDADSGSYKKVGVFIHKYAPHVKDWRAGDPSWKNGKGKGIIGAINYLASKGVNSVYFLTYNLDGGDGRDTWMWTGPTVRDRFDVSKLDQWEIVFSHMERKGIMLHVVTQETENDRALGGGPGLNPIRRLYYRELVARFAHHNVVLWNLGEENNTPDKDRKEIAAYIRTLDAYRHPITVHTHNNKQLDFYNGILGDANFETTSIQGAMSNYNRDAIALRKKSADAGRKWVIFGDEQPPANKGVVPDADDPAHDEPRTQALWGNLMGGGAGVEWYFGSNYAHMDINLEDFRSRDKLWDQTRYALDFFRKHLRFWQMEPDNERASGAANVRVLAEGDAIIAVYLPVGGAASVKLGNGRYTVHWYNPRAGGSLVAGQVTSLQGPGEKSIGLPPADPNSDWVALLRQASAPASSKVK